MKKVMYVAKDGPKILFSVIFIHSTKKETRVEHKFSQNSSRVINHTKIPIVLKYPLSL